MRPGLMTPLAQVMRVAPAAVASPSQAAHWMTPSAPTSTWPPRSAPPSVSTVPSMSIRSSPSVTVQVPVAGAVSTRPQSVVTPPDDDDTPLLLDDDAELLADPLTEPDDVDPGVPLLPEPLMEE